MFAWDFQREGAQELGQTGSIFSECGCPDAKFRAKFSPFCESKQGSRIQGYHGYCSTAQAPRLCQERACADWGWPIPCSSKPASASEALWWAGQCQQAEGATQPALQPQRQPWEASPWRVTDAAAAAILCPAPPFNGREQSQDRVVSCLPPPPLPAPTGSSQNCWVRATLFDVPFFSSHPCFSSYFSLLSSLLLSPLAFSFPSTSWTSHNPSPFPLLLPFIWSFTLFWLFFFFCGGVGSQVSGS